MKAVRLTGEFLGKGGRARERAEGRLGVQVEGIPDGDGGVRILRLRIDRVRLHGASAVAAWTRGRDGGSGEGGEGSGEESEEVHDGVYDVGYLGIYRPATQGATPTV